MVAPLNEMGRMRNIVEHMVSLTFVAFIWDFLNESEKFSTTILSF